ncbi:MAG: hypothetical protein GY945_10315 [Rhodobacteraceae bacterium]|nr:hypothetical protein [Paracoccaceae bacterium]
MPSQAKSLPPRGDICIFGDSHIASVQRALQGKLIDTGRRKVTFWGADGPSFRALRWHRGRIVPDASVRDMVRKISGGSHEDLGPQDFDLFIFYGARLRPHEFFTSILKHQRQPEGQLSSAAMQAIVSRWTNKTRAWRFAQAFADAGATVMFVPASLPSQNVLDSQGEKEQLAVRSTKAERAALWRILGDEAANAGFTLIPQPDESVTSDTLTKAEYATSDARANNDWVHKSPEFAALMVASALHKAESISAMAAE